MADYEDINDIESMTDDGLTELVRNTFADRDDIDVSRLELDVSGGRVRVAGRVGTDAEAQIVDQVLSDVIGIRDLSNEIVVDPLVRQQQPEAADTANAAVYDGGSARGGADRTADSAEHLLDDTTAEQYGTSDAGEAIERGHSYNPPDGPVQEGTWNREDH